tara:strand:+ start:6920 stop:7258 length:339 start_codon:yes stop_codon:yes gene_type:complete
MASRYDGRTILENSNDLYRNVFRNRGVKQIEHYSTPTIAYPTPEQMSEINVLDHIWSRGDHYYKLADYYYGDSKYWWVVALFNKKPTEDQLTFGDIVMVPTPLETILRFYEA